MLESRDRSLSAELAQLRQHMEAAGVQAAALRLATAEQLRDLQSWAHTSLEALQARSRAGCC